VVRITMPSLRERKEDIPIWSAILTPLLQANDKPLLELAPDAMDALLIYNCRATFASCAPAIEHASSWQRAQNYIARSTRWPCASSNGEIARRGFSSGFREKTSPLDLHETERRLIAQALAADQWQRDRRAKKLGISRRTLHRKINEMNLAKAAPSGDS